MFVLGDIKMAINLSNRIHYEAVLQCVSEQMIRHPQSDNFMKWVCHYLLIQLQPEHVSIALYNHKTHMISIEFSEGKFRIPPRLISLDPSSSLIRWFEAENGTAASLSRYRKLISSRDLRRSSDPQVLGMLHELMRHHTEICAKIETYKHLAGYLMVGPRLDRKHYSSDDAVFFQILANDIAIEIEKEEYYCSAQYDPLTGLFNRNALVNILPAYIQKAKEQQSRMAVALLDIDNFKQINDVYGHLVGDRVLHIAAEILRDNIRKTDLAFRYGGEEFLILLPASSRNPLKKIEDEEFRKGILAVTERLRENSSRPVECLSHKIAFTLSLGVTFFDGTGDKDADRLIAEADAALYKSKKTGKNRVTVFVPDGS